MSGERSPWWYSGDDELGDRGESVPPPGPADSVESTSGTADDTDPDASAPVDWMGLLSGAARMVDWATTAVMAPHAEHADPADHPQCLVCRTILLVGDPSDLLRPKAEPDDAPVDADEPVIVDARVREGALAVTWIPFADEGTADGGIAHDA
jgi:hypothetical protein